MTGERAPQDIGAVNFDQLTELPQEISGTLHRVAFVDLDGRNPISGIVLTDSEVFTQGGKRLKLLTPSMQREFFIAATDDRPAPLPLWDSVALDKLLKHLEALGGPDSEVKVNFKFK